MRWANNMPFCNDMLTQVDIALYSYLSGNFNVHSAFLSTLTYLHAFEILFEMSVPKPSKKTTSVKGQ